MDEETREMFQEMFLKIDCRLNGMDARLESMDARLGAIDKHLGRIDGRMEGLEVRQGKMSRQLEDLKLEHMVFTHMAGKELRMLNDGMETATELFRMHGIIPV